MKHSTSSSQRESSKPPFEVTVSCRRRVVSADAYSTMMSSDRLSTLLCHDVDTKAAFARARFAYSVAKSWTKVRPVVRNGFGLLRTGGGFLESTFMPLDVATVTRRCRRVFEVCCALSNAILDQRFSRHQMPGVSLGAPVRVNLLSRHPRRGSQGNFK
jgi:hypothetical protein